jgi:hypothetical protein
MTESSELKRSDARRNRDAILEAALDAPGDALRGWVERLARYAVTKHGLADALRKASSPGSDPSLTETYSDDLRNAPPSRSIPAPLGAPSANRTSARSSVF